MSGGTPSTVSPISVGERLHTRWEFVPIFENALAHYIMPDVTWTGGISEMKKIATLAESYFVPISPHNAMGPLQVLAGCHVMSTVPNFYRLEYNMAAIPAYNIVLTEPIHFQDGAVHLNPVAVVATALLATPKHAADAAQLADIVERLLRLAAQARTAPEAVATTVSGVEAITHTARLGYLQRQSHALGDVVMASDDAAVALTYFRNNVLHCFALPGLIACLIVQHGVIGKTKLARLARELYVLLESELYLPPWRAETVAATHDDVEPVATAAERPDATLFPPFERTLATMASDGWVSMEADAAVVSASPAGTDAAIHLELLAATIRPALTRHALMLALAGRAPSGEQSREAVESLCQQAAQHLAMTHVFNAPEFSDRSQFRSAFDALLRVGLLQVDSADSVHYGPELKARADEAAFLLPPDTRAAVLRAAQRRPGQIAATA